MFRLGVPSGGCSHQAFQLVAIDEIDGLVGRELAGLSGEQARGDYRGAQCSLTDHDTVELADYGDTHFLGFPVLALDEVGLAVLLEVNINPVSAGV